MASSSMAYMPPDLAKRVRARFKCPLMIAYGSTEGGGITGTGIGRRQEGDDGDDRHVRPAAPS